MPRYRDRRARITSHRPLTPPPSPAHAASRAGRSSTGPSPPRWSTAPCSPTRPPPPPATGPARWAPPAAWAARWHRCGRWGRRRGASRWRSCGGVACGATRPTPAPWPARTWARCGIPAPAFLPHHHRHLLPAAARYSSRQRQLKPARASRAGGPVLRPPHLPVVPRPGPSCGPGAAGALRPRTAPRGRLTGGAGPMEME
jgi:hypothetical protein